MPVLCLDDWTLDEVLAGADRPVLVEFTADWCGPCKVLEPILDELSTELEASVIIGKLDVDTSLRSTQRHGVMSMPTLVLFVDGQEKRRLVGARGKRRLVHELSEYLPA